MAHRVVWSARAIADVDAIVTYIAANSPSYARTVARKILMSTRSLAQFPFSGRVVPEVDDHSLREVFAYSYRVIYWVKQDEVVLTAVIHGRRVL